MLGELDDDGRESRITYQYSETILPVLDVRSRKRPVFVMKRRFDANEGGREVVGRPSVDEASMSVLGRGVLVKVSFQVGVLVGAGFCYAARQGGALHKMGIGIGLRIHRIRDLWWGVRTNCPAITKIFGFRASLVEKSTKHFASLIDSPQGEPTQGTLIIPHLYVLLYRWTESSMSQSTTLATENRSN